VDVRRDAHYVSASHSSKDNYLLASIETRRRSDAAITGHYFGAYALCVNIIGDGLSTRIY
jgi:hypothetical protein